MTRSSRVGQHLGEGCERDTATIGLGPSAPDACAAGGHTRPSAHASGAALGVRIIALPGRGEAALRRDAGLVDVDANRRLLGTAQDVVDAPGRADPADTPPGITR
ncbi:MAG: hypothetical protein ACFBWO_00230 [Paracoccaceae bacterium]